jgi:uncharacterized protein YegL
VVKRGAANLSTAVLTSIKKIEDRLNELDNVEISNYLPFLVLVTDGGDKTDDPENLEKAIQSVLRHCEVSKDTERLIAPYIIGVGEQADKILLNRFAEKFTGEAIIIDDAASCQQNMFKDVFKELFDLIIYSATGDFKEVCDLKSFYESTRKTLTYTQKEWASRTNRDRFL